MGKKTFENSVGKGENAGNYCDHAVSVKRHGRLFISRLFLPCVCSRGHIFSPILMKLGQNICLNEILDEIENGSCQVKN